MKREKHQLGYVEWERIRPEVEEALGTWKSGAA